MQNDNVTNCNNAIEQQYLNPPSLFDCLAQDRFWTCVRVRPRWEKRFTRWLLVKGIPHYFPVYRKNTVSHRKHTVSELPLFPGYVFVPGNHNKTTFSDSGCVVRVIKPAGAAESRHLDRQLQDIWKSLEAGLFVFPTTDFAPMEEVEVIDGPLRGTIGRFLNTGRNGALVLSVDMLGTNVAVALEQNTRVEPVCACQPVAC